MNVLKLRLYGNKTELVVILLNIYGQFSPV